MNAGADTDAIAVRFGPLSQISTCLTFDYGVVLNKASRLLPMDTETTEEKKDSIESTTPEDLRKVAERTADANKRQYDTCFQYRQPKLDKILKAEELYFNIVTRTIKGRFNIPLPIVSGYVDTLLSKIDDEITVNFDKVEDADAIKCRKCAAAWKYDSAPTRGMWAIKDILVKKLAIFSGRGIYKIFSASQPYKNYFEGVDLFDFFFEPTGGWHLENHLYCGIANIFKTKHDLENNDMYDQTQVAKLIAATGEKQYKENKDLYQNRLKRHNMLGLDSETYNFTGVDVYSLAEWNFYDNETGKRYYKLFDPVSGIWIRIAPLDEITGEPEEGELPRYMFKSWATHLDYWNFLSKAPVDDVVPVAVAMKTLTNFMFDEVQKNLWGQRYYDPDMITDPSQMEWDRPDKLIQALVPNGKRISDAVWQFPTGDKSTVTVNMLDYMRNFAAVESGVTPGSKGESDEKVLGIAEINQGEVADRLGLTNKQYTQCYAELGDAYLSGLKMCLTEKRLIRMIGEKGMESTEITKDDLKFDSRPDVRITGGKTEARKNQAIQEAKNNSLINAAKIFPGLFNPKIAAENMLRNGQWEIDEITPMLDKNIEGNEDEDVHASQAIQAILKGTMPPMYRGATTRFTQKIIDYANTLTDKKDEKLAAEIFNYAIMHTQIVDANMKRRQMLGQLGQPPQDMGQPAPQPDGSVKSPYVSQPTQ